MSSSLIASLRSAIREFGVRDGIGYLVDRLLMVRLRWGGLARYILTAQPIPDDPLPLRPGKLSFQELKPGDPRLRDLPLSDKVLDFRFGQNAVCIAAIENDRAVACIWFCFGHYDEDMVRCRYVLEPEQETAWDFDVYVAPEHRMGRTFARLWAAANEYLRARGVRWSLSRISGYNPASFNSHKRLGARVIGRASFLRIGNWQLMWSNRAPYLHLSRKAQPRLRVRAPKSP